MTRPPRLPPQPPTPEAPALARPASPGAMFLVFTVLALQGFGGVLPVAQRALVDRQRWLSPQQFVEMLALAQVLPGPNVVNLSLMVGDRFFGWRGALAGMAGMLLAPLCVVLLLAALVSHFRGHPVVDGAVHGMGVVAAGLVAATALRLAAALRRNPLGLLPCAALGLLAAGAVGGQRWPLVSVVLGLGLPAMAAAWWRLGRVPPP